MTRIATTGAGTLMHVRRWVGLGLGMAVTACTPGTKSGGAIVETEGDAEDGATEASTGGDSMEGQGDSDTEGAAACAAAPACGNGVVDALEECEGAEACNECSSTQAPIAWIDGDGEIDPIAVGSDDTVFALTQSSESEYTLRHYDGSGDELWSEVPTDDLGIIALALDDAGNAYAAGMQQVDPGGPQANAWISAWDATGAPSWTFTSTELAFFADVTAADDRVAAAGGNRDGVDLTARLQLFDLDGTSAWTVVDDGLDVFSNAAIVGTDVVVTATLGEVDTTLSRYDGEGVLRWSVDLPVGEMEGPIGGTRAQGVIADGGSGTWTYGTTSQAPWAVHHDADGNEIASYDCIGGMNGRVDGATVDDDGRLALAITVELLVDEVTYSQAWFPVFAGDEVTRAVMFGDVDSGNSAGASVVAWRSDGALVVGWTRYYEEGGPGSTEVLSLAPP